MTDFMTDEDAPIELAKPMSPVAMKESFLDFRSSRGQIRIGQRGEDGSLEMWDSLFRRHGSAKLAAAYDALKASPVYFNGVVRWLEEQAHGQLVDKTFKPDWPMRLLALLSKKNPTEYEARAIGYLRKIAKERGIYSLDLARCINGERVVLPAPTDATVAAVLGRDDALIKRMRARGLL